MIMSVNGKNVTSKSKLLYICRNISILRKGDEKYVYISYLVSTEQNQEADLIKILYYLILTALFLDDVSYHEIIWLNEILVYGLKDQTSINQWNSGVSI